MIHRRKKGFSATHSKLTSRRLRSATVGTHVPRRPGSSRHMNGEAVGFSSPSKQKRAARGFVDNVLPATSPREGSRRVSQREFTQGIQRRARIRRIVVIVVCLVVVVAIAAAVGVAAFFGSLDAKMSLGDSDAASALVAAKEAEPFYAVVAADLDAAGSTSAVNGPDAVALVRVDTAAKAVTVISVPPDLQTSLKDGNIHPLREAATSEGDAALVRAVADFAGVDVSHFVKVDAEGIQRLVDAFDGVEVDVPEEVDDPAAGDVYIPAGVQTLDGKGALTLLRAANFTNGLETQAANQRALLTSLSLRMLDAGSFGLLTTLDSVGDAIATDMGASGAIALVDALRGINANAVRGALVPGYETTYDEKDYYVASTDSWTEMMGLVQEGQDPVVEEKTPTVDPGSFTVTVRNGTDITGAAAQIAESLKQRGYQVKGTDNADAQVYDETLVVYDDDKFAAAAESTVATLGTGRAVQGGGFYTFDTDVLVVLGKDWKPAS